MSDRELPDILYDVSVLCMHKQFDILGRRRRKMLGAIIGDIAGSRFEWNNIKTKEFDFLTYRCHPTDDSVMTLAVAKALMESRNVQTSLSKEVVKWMQALGRKYPNSGFGGRFRKWLISESPEPYNSYGNGAAMRVSPCAYVADSLEEAKNLSRIVTEVTHNHSEGVKGAEAVTTAIYMALHGSSLLEIQDYISANYYSIAFKLDDIRSTYTFDVSCQGSVPQALEVFFESADFEDAVRNAISIGGDSDTIAAIAGSIAGAVT
jgi:type I restriction enzyme M protein